MRDIRKGAVSVESTDLMYPVEVGWVLAGRREQDIGWGLGANKIK